MAKKLDEGTVRRLSVIGSVDPRSIRRAFKGIVVRGLAGERARAALREAGLLNETLDRRENSTPK